LVIALLGVAISLLIAISVGESEPVKEQLGRRVRIFLVAAIAQGGIGYLQYFTGLPELVVALHILGSVLVWLAAWNLAVTGRVRIIR
jgi:cytochrome c oxidase assembly protein subunit 15